MGLVCAELGSAIPRKAATTSGSNAASAQYRGFQCGWWSWLTTFVDSAVYIALIRDYLASWLDLSPSLAWPLGVAIIAVFAATSTSAAST